MKLKLFLILGVLAFLCAGSLYAGTDFGVQVDYNRFNKANQGDTGVGARLMFGNTVSLITSFDYYFGNRLDNLKFYEVNANLVYVVPAEQVRPYFGAGAGIAHQSFDATFIPNSETKVGFNLVAGIKFEARVKPFFEFRYVLNNNGTIFSNHRYVLTGGILF